MTFGCLNSKDEEVWVFLCLQYLYLGLLVYCQYLFFPPKLKQLNSNDIKHIAWAQKSWDQICEVSEIRFSSQVQMVGEIAF